MRYEYTNIQKIEYFNIQLEIIFKISGILQTKF